MRKRKDSAKGVKGTEGLQPEEARELEMILDRLQVQDPEGESLPSFVQSLRQALAGREPLASALLEHIGKQPSEVGRRAFVSLRDLFDSKPYRRLVRQVEYRLSQKGYVVGSQAPPEEEQRVVLIHKEERRAVAHVIPDTKAFGLAGALIPGEQLENPLAVFTIVYDGLRQRGVKIVDSSQRGYREFLQNTSGRFSVKPYDIPVWHAARIFYDSLKFSEEVSDYAKVERAKQLFKPYYDPDRLPYVYELMPAVGDPDREIMGIDVADLLDSIDTFGLLFKKDDLVSYYEKLMGIAQSILVISPEIKEQRTTALIAEAADQLCTGLIREHHQRFFEEMALRFKQHGKDDQATAAWITAQQLRSTSSPGSNPVITELILASMEKHWPDAFKEKETEQGEDRFQRTESGLIIPR